MAKRLLYILVLLFAVGCGYNDFSDVRYQPNVVPPAVNEELRAVAEVCGDTPYFFTDPIVVEGRVIANDRSGNFYRTIIIDDGTAALAIKLNFYDLHNLFRIGQRVVVDCEGLVVMREQGVTTLGSRVEAWNATRVEGFALRSEADKHIFRLADVEAVEPSVVSIGNLDDRLCGRLVRFDNLTLLPDTLTGITWAASPEENPYSSQSVRYFHTPLGDSLAVVTSLYADFAPNPIPTEPLSLTGVLMRGASGTPKSDYSLKLRDSLDYAPY